MSGGLLSLKWNNHQSTFLHVLSSLCLNDTLSDVTLACEGEFYSAHKLVLATCSEYFEKIFEKIEGKHSVIVLKDVKAEELEALLTYMYEGEVNVLQEKLSGLIKAAEYLKVKGLSDSDENPEVFSKSYSKRSGKNSFSKEDSSSPPAKRRRQTSENSHPESVNDSNTKTGEGQEQNPAEVQESVVEVRETFSQQNQQVFDIDAVKEEADMEIQNEPFGFRDESSHFLNDQDENLPQIGDISLPSVSSQPQVDKDPSASIFSEEGNTSNNMWDIRDVPNVTVSNANRKMQNSFEEFDIRRKLSSGEYKTVTVTDRKSEVWNTFYIIVNQSTGNKLDYVLCQICNKLLSYKGSRGGTSHLSRHKCHAITSTSQKCFNSGFPNISCQQEHL